MLSTSFDNSPWVTKLPPYSITASRALAGLCISLLALQSPRTDSAIYIPNCEYEVIGTTVPATSGTPALISDVTGTVISANFFNGGAIDPPYFDGQEFVSVCVSPFDSNGNRTAELTSNVGRDNDFIIKGYPQFIVGTKFGNIYETSFRYYPNTGLAASDRWPVVSAGTDQNGQPFEFANLEYISNKKGLGLPAFTNSLPSITVKFDIDEYNVEGSERDVMLESWFYDTATNAAIIGNNLATGEPVANTLNNIVGIGHRHYPQLNNTLLEMMVHIGPLSPNDISGANNNPGQHQLTENYSGKDNDNDGIDDHFDVDSHTFVNSTEPSDPSPGLYSSGIDANADGIDDADFLPIVVGDFAYSIWYGESFLAPIVIYSRETNSSLNSDFDPLVADMDLSLEGPIELPWNDFLNYTMFDLQSKLQEANVAWASGTTNPFDKMSGASGMFGAIGGVELGVEPQTNNATDDTYSAVLQQFEVLIDGKSFGLADTSHPTAIVTSPADSSAVTQSTTVNVSGTATDTESGIDQVSIRIQRLGVSPPLYWDGNTWTNTSNYLNAVLSNSNNNWTLPDVDLNSLGKYRIRLRVNDNAGNIANATDNPKADFYVVGQDNAFPTAQATFPANGSTINSGIISISGTSFDDVSGVDIIKVRVQRLGSSPALYWNGSSWTPTSTYLDATLNNAGTSWTLSGVDVSSIGNYRIRLHAYDKAGNFANATDNPKTDFTVVVPDIEIPLAQATSPSDGSTINSGIFDISGNSSDDASGIDIVRVRIRRLGSSPAQFWNGSNWTSTSTYLDTILNNTGTSWTLPDVDLTTIGNYRIRLHAYDNAGNFAKATDNPKADFSIN